MPDFVANHILSLIIFVPIVGAAVVFSRTAWDPVTIRRAALGIALVTLALAVLACGQFLEERTHWGDEPGGIGLVEQVDWIASTAVGNEGGIRIQYHVGVDGISLPLLLLTALLTPLAMWASFSGIQSRQREYYALLLLLHGAMLGVFCARDLLLFYVFFEFTLIPLYFLIGIWGGAQRQKAANMFFIYTLTGSMLTFAAVLYLGWKAAQFPIVPGGGHYLTFDLEHLYHLAAVGHLTPTEQGWLFMAFFAGFAIKVPLFPFHTWLPLAHTEAPTAGSVILAAILLKLGTYGFLRLSLPMLPEATVHFAPLIGGLAVAGIIYGALAAWVQSDIKKLVAYSSVSHLGFCLLGLFSLKMAGLTGALLYMVNHGLSTGALFLVVGMIYERYHTREIADLGGLGRKMPILTFFLIVFTMASIGLPGLNGFVSEFLVLLGTFNSAKMEDGWVGPLGVWFAVPAATGVLLGAIYMLHMVRCIVFGPLKEPHGGHDASTGLTADLTRREIGVLAPIAVACLFLGVYPKPLMNIMEPSLDADILVRVQQAQLAPLKLADESTDEAADTKCAATAVLQSESVAAPAVVPHDRRTTIPQLAGVRSPTISARGGPAP